MKVQTVHALISYEYITEYNIFGGNVTKKISLLHGIFTDDEIKKYRHAKKGLKCYLIPLNKYIENGMVI